jgi:hypothetical protein
VGFPVTIEAEDEGEGRAIAHHVFGPVFCTSYKEEPSYPHKLIEVKKVPKIYGFHNSRNPHADAPASAIAEDGHGLAGHFCSNESFARHDLGMNGTSNWKHENYNKHYPDCWCVEFVPCDEVMTHKGLSAAYDKNQELRKLAKQKRLDDKIDGQVSTVKED